MTKTFITHVHFHFHPCHSVSSSEFECSSVSRGLTSWTFTDQLVPTKLFDIRIISHRICVTGKDAVWTELMLKREQTLNLIGGGKTCTQHFTEVKYSPCRMSTLRELYYYWSLILYHTVRSSLHLYSCVTGVSVFKSDSEMFVKPRNRNSGFCWFLLRSGWTRVQSCVHVLWLTPPLDTWIFSSLEN